MVSLLRIHLCTASKGLIHACIVRDDRYIQVNNFPVGFSKELDEGLVGSAPEPYNYISYRLPKWEKIIFYQTLCLPNGIRGHGYKNTAESDREPVRRRRYGWSLGCRSALALQSL